MLQIPQDYHLIELVCEYQIDEEIRTPKEAIEAGKVTEACIAVSREFVIFPNTIDFRHTNELRNFALTTQQRKFFICSFEYGLLLEAARLVVFRLVECLRRNGFAGC